MAKSAYEIWLSTNDNKERLRLPVLPARIDISTASKNESADIANLGEVTILQDPAPKYFSFSAYFPLHESPLVEYSNHPEPWEAIETIEKWKKEKKPLRLVVTRTPINYLISVESFNYNEEGGSVGDISYDLSLKEFNVTTVRKIKTESSNKATKNPVRTSSKQKEKTHQVKQGDTLWAIARKAYGDGTEWRSIWEANKDMLIQRDPRNRKQPGHWIYPEQVLRLP